MIEILNAEDHHYKTGFHGKPLIIAWLPLVNFAVLFASIKWCKYTFYFHLILSMGVIALTLLSTVHILVDDWLSPNEDFKIQKVHNIAGLAVTIWLGVQIITGILARVIQSRSDIRTNTCVLIKRVHYISSYLLMLVSKFNYLNIKFMKGKYLEFAQYFVIEMMFLALYLWIKSSYWTLSEDIIDGQLTNYLKEQRRNKISYFILWLKDRILNLKSQIMQKTFHLPKISKQLPKIKSQSEIQVRKYITFNDVVYDISNLKSLHPGGQSVINLMNKREVNRFLYGYYKPQNDHKLTTHTHTKESLRLCGEPIAKIERIIPIEGFDCLTKFKIAILKPILQDSNVWAVYLQPTIQQRSNWIRLNFTGYQEQSQLGQHLSLTICDKKGRKRCTRLYTSVWCMRTQNLQFMGKIIPNSIKFNTSTYREVKEKDYGLNQSLLETETETDTNSSDIDINIQLVPLVIKKYNKGALTSRLIVEDFQGQIILSKPMGSGMRYQDLPDSGKIIFVCGGTGILPFCDFIDILFKRVKLLQGTTYSEQIKSKDPLVEVDLIKRRQFVLYYATESSSDILLTTLNQLDYLCGSKQIQFSAILKIKRNAESIKQNFKLFKYQQTGFNEQIEQSLTKQLSKIYICGPYKMNEDMSRIFKKHNIDEDMYHFM